MTHDACKGSNPTKPRDEQEILQEPRKYVLNRKDPEEIPI